MRAAKGMLAGRVDASLSIALAARSPRPMLAVSQVHAARCSTSYSNSDQARALVPRHPHRSWSTPQHPCTNSCSGDAPAGPTDSTRYQRGRAEDMAAPSLLVAANSQSPTASPHDMLEILPLLSPKQLADAIWGFAKQGHKPTNEFMATAAQEVLSKLDHFRSQDLSNTIWALAVLKYQPDAGWWAQFERQVYNNVTDFTSREIANLMWALAVLDHRPEWILDSVLAHVHDNFASSSANSLHLILWSLGKLGHVPGVEWMAEFQRVSQASFFQFSPSEMANVIWAFAKLGTKLPSLYLDNFLMVAQWRFPSFSAKLLSILVWSAAMLDHHPSADWVVVFQQQIREKFDEFSGQELACTAWALRRFGYTGDANAVFYMLEHQEGFSEVDYEILSNPKLLGQVMTWRGSSSGGSSSSGGGGSSSGGGGGTDPPPT